jgi:hypothetical protein
MRTLGRNIRAEDTSSSSFIPPVPTSTKVCKDWRIIRRREGYPEFAVGTGLFSFDSYSATALIELQAGRVSSLMPVLIKK